MPVIKLLFLTIVLPGDFVVAPFDAKLRWRFLSHALIYPFGNFKSWQVCPILLFGTILLLNLCDLPPYTLIWHYMFIRHTRVNRAKKTG